jgi:signal transduction histidine kinase
LPLLGNKYLRVTSNDATGHPVLSGAMRTVRRALVQAVGIAVLLADSPQVLRAAAPPVSRQNAAAARSVSPVVDRDSSATILMIDDIDVTRPIFLQAITGIRDAVNTGGGRRALLHVESLGLHSRSAVRGQRLIARLADEYAGEPIDLMIATGDTSIVVAQQLRARWGRDIPIVGLQFTNLGHGAPTLPNGTLMRMGDMNAATARDIRSLLPTVDEVLIIAATPADANGAVGSVRAELGAGVRVRSLVAPALEELAPHFAQLSARAAIVYLAVGRDSRGRSWQVREYLRRLTVIAPRPVFAWLGSYLGTGIVGGPMLEGLQIGREIGRVATSILDGAAAAAIAPVVIDRSRTVYDWPVLQRFGIPVDRLPQGALLVNRPLPAWESYPRTSRAIAILIAALLTGVVLLVHNRRQVRAANAARLAESRRLLQAQDEERVRIARDLHDDLGQEMTMLALELTRVPEQPLDRADLSSRVHWLIDRTRSIAMGLHASHIGGMPLQDALAVHVANLRERTGLDIRVHATTWIREPHPTVAVALFRAVQEALQNTVRHADASQITITLRSTADVVQMEVTDDGIGFQPNDRASAGLGMASMRERLASVGGTFAVHSVPFGGTTISLSAPCGIGA